jgi:hypothetical protein
MGDTIRSSAAVDDIFADVRTTHQNAIARGGVARTLAEERIGPTIAGIDAIEAELGQARQAALPLVTEVRHENDRADAFVGRIYDEIWNDVGRSANDRWLTLLFPGGTGYYTEGDTAEQPHRMELLAQMLERGVHPKLTEAQAAGYAARTRAAAAELSADLDAARLPAAQVVLLERVRTAVARTAQADLVALKRLYKNEGMSEAEIHTIIPDRPPPKKAKTKGA